MSASYPWFGRESCPSCFVMAWSVTNSMLTAGQAGDNPMLAPLIQAFTQCGHGMEFRLLADKPYSHRSTRTFRRDRRTKHTIQERSDQIARRKSKGSKGGRPPAFDPATYKPRNTVERSFNRF